MEPIQGQVRLSFGKCLQIVKEFQSFDLVRIAVSATLLISLSKDSYRYYSLFKGVCFATFGAAAYAAYLSIRQKKYGWTWALIILAMTYYPFQRIDDDSPLSAFQIKYRFIANIVASLVLLLSIYVLKNRASKKSIEGNNL